MIVLLVPDPAVVVNPGVLINVQGPDPGKPVSNTLPVDTEHVG